MGMLDNVRQRIRSVFAREKKGIEQATQMSQGVQPTGFDTFSIYGRYGIEPLVDYLRIEQELISRYMDYNEMQSMPEIFAALDCWADESCLTADTEIPMLDGTVKTVEYLYKNDVRNGWVYSFDPDKKKCVAGCFEKVQKIASNVRIIKITYKDKMGVVGTIKVTPEHKFLMLSCSYKKAGELKVGDKLMGVIKFVFDDKKLHNKYENILVSPFKKQWRSTHRMVLNSLDKQIPPGYFVHHIDHNGLNNSPSNLAAVSREEHQKIHDCKGSKNPRYRHDVTIDQIESLICEKGFLSLTDLSSRFNCGKRVLGRILKESIYGSWSNLKQSLFGLKKNSYGKATKDGTKEKYIHLIEHVKTFLLDHPSTPFSEIRRRFGPITEYALKFLGYAGWNDFRKSHNIPILKEGNRTKETILSNHTIINIEDAGIGEVYDLVNCTPVHNFASGNGGTWVYVKNTQFDVLTGRTMWVESDDDQVKKILQNLIDNNLQMEDEVWGLCRELVMYGNSFSELLCTQEGVIGLNAIPPETIRRYEKGKGLLVGFAQDPRGSFGVTVEDVEKALNTKEPTPANMAYFEPWQIAHMRLTTQQRQSPYGSAVLESARWIWRRLLLLEDASMIHRLTRLPMRWLFYIDVGKLPPTQALGQLRRMKNEFTKQKFINERGSLDLRTSPLASDENLFLPVVDGKRTTEVELMATPEWQVMDDVNYFRDKMFTALKIPKAYLSADEPTRARVLCLSGNTSVPLLDGRKLTIKNIVESIKKKEEMFVYSCNEKGMITHGKILDAVMTRPQANTWEIVLDNGERVRGTPDHPIMMRDGSYKKIEDITVGESVMPFETRISKFSAGDKLDGYEKVRNPGNNTEEYTHTIIARERLLRETGEEIHFKNAGLVIHHSDFNKRNNNPTNLEALEKDTHFKLHSELCKKTLHTPLASAKREKALYAWRHCERLQIICRANLDKARGENGGQRAWCKSEEHRGLKSEQMKKQWADPNSKMRDKIKSKEFKDFMSAEMKRRIQEGIVCVRGEANNRYRKDASYNTLEHLANSGFCKTLREFSAKTGYSVCLITRVLRQQGFSSYRSFADLHVQGGFKGVKKGERMYTLDDLIKFMQSYRSVNRTKFSALIGCSAFTVHRILSEGGLSWGAFLKKYGNPPKVKCLVGNHKVVAINKNVSVEDCYDLRIDSTDNFAISAGTFVHNSLEDVRFARGVMRVQRELKNGMKRICKVHLAALGIDPEKVHFDIFMTVPSWAYELSQIEVKSARAEFAEKVSPYLSEKAIMRLVFGYSDDEIDALRKEKAEEQREAGESGLTPPEKGKGKGTSKTEGSSIMDLPGLNRVAPENEEKIEKNLHIIKEQVGEILDSNKDLAKRIRRSQDFMQDIKSATMFKSSSGRTKVIKSFGMGENRHQG